MNTTQKRSKNLIMRTAGIIACIGIFVMLINACTKATDKAHMAIRMTDAPGNFTEVNVNVKAVEVVTDNGGTFTLNTNAGIYNLLDLSNGKDTLIATGDIDAGTVSQIRLILGDSNTVVVDSVVYPLETPSAMQSGLKIQIHKTFEPGVTYGILLDFDANQSIVLKGNGGYLLKPVIRSVDTALSGSIKGSITPINVVATVSATSNGVTYSTVTNAKGEFVLSGLPAGTYDITITPPAPLLAVTVTGKVVVVGASTNLGIIVL